MLQLCNLKDSTSMKTLCTEPSTGATAKGMLSEYLLTIEIPYIRKYYMTTCIIILTDYKECIFISS